MAENLLSFRAGIPITADGQLPSIEFLRFLNQSIIRQGGAVGPTIQEIDSQQYADAGIEENKAQINVTRDDLSKSPLSDLSQFTPQFEALQRAPVYEQATIDILTSEVHALRERVTVLITEIENLKAKP